MLCISLQTTWECQGQEPAVEEQQRREFEDFRWHLIRKVHHNEPDSEKWKCFSRTWHKQSCGISHLSWSGCWCVKPAHIWKYKTQCGASWVFLFFPVVVVAFLINVAFCLCEPVKIRLVFHSKFGLYTYTKTLHVTHRQLGVRTHTLRWTLPPICEANSFCHKWSQIGSAQSPITPHLGWP